MGISYDNLKITLEKKGYKKTDLLNVISSRTLAKLNKNEVITTETIEKICLFLDCQPNDIMQVFPEDKNETIKREYKKFIYIPNSNKTYTKMQRKLFDSMVREKIITQEQINKWLKEDKLFKESYEYKN